MSARGQSVVKRVEDALLFAEKLLATKPLFAQANPQVAERFNKVKSQNRSYLAHEYFNQDWSPISFSRMCDWLVQAKLDYACSANYLDQVESIQLTVDQLALLSDIPDLQFRQTVRDFCMNQQFRKDYWIKGSTRLSDLTKSEALRAQRYILVAQPENVKMTVGGAVGEAKLSGRMYEPVLRLMSDHLPKTIAEIEKSLEKTHNLAQIAQCMLILAGKGDVAAAQDEKTVSDARSACGRLNQYLINYSRGSNDVEYLASPVLGGGVPVNRFHQLFLLARVQGHKTPEELGAFCWDTLRRQGQRLIREGRAVENDQENLAEFITHAREFLANRLPLLKAIGVAA